MSDFLVNDNHHGGQDYTDERQDFFKEQDHYFSFTRPPRNSRERRNAFAISSGPMPSSLKPNLATGCENTQIHQPAATKYPTGGANLVRNVYLEPHRETLIT